MIGKVNLFIGQGFVNGRARPFKKHPFNLNPIILEGLFNPAINSRDGTG